MITGKREPTGVELHMTIDEANMLRMSLYASGKACARLIAVGPQGQPVPGSQIDLLPDAVIKVLREQARAHFDLSESITRVTTS